MSFKKTRISILLIILFAVGADHILSKIRATSWDDAVRVVIYPINADNSSVSAAYIQSLDASNFSDINTHATNEARRYGMNNRQLFDIKLSNEVNDIPTLPPKNNNILSAMWWSLSFRFWSWRADNYEGITPEIRVFALYYDPIKTPSLSKSTALEKGQVVLANLFSDRKHKGSNNMVILHEMLHTAGATDKYDLTTQLPFYPDGFAEPELQPRYPQRKAEIMGGRIPVSTTKANIPRSLKSVIVGPLTAQEIGWSKP